MATKPNLYIIDLDGTLYDNSHRQHLIPQNRDDTAQWEAFNAACRDDVVRPAVAELVRTLFNCSASKVIFLTGRGESARQQTMRCLWDEFAEYDIRLMMRPMNEHRRAAIWKREEVEKLSYLHEGRNILCIEDDPEVVAHMRRLPGVTVLAIDSYCAAVISEIREAKRAK